MWINSGGLFLNRGHDVGMTVACGDYRDTRGKVQESFPSTSSHESRRARAGRLKDRREYSSATYSARLRQ